MPRFHTIDDVAVTGKRVLLRADLNVPVKDGKVTDATRIERLAPTIEALIAKGAKTVVLSHFGRPKGVDPSQSLKPLTAPLSRAIGGKTVHFATDCVGQRNVRAHFEACPHVRPLHGTCTPRIHSIQTRSVPDSFQNMMKENRMCLPGVRSPEKNHIGFFNLLIGIATSAYPKDRRQTGDAWGVSSAVAAIDVVAAHHDTRELLSNEVHFVRRL